MTNEPKTQENTLPDYQPPRIILELELETHAGSPLGLPDGLDIFEE